MFRLIVTWLSDHERSVCVSKSSLETCQSLYYLIVIIRIGIFRKATILIQGSRRGDVVVVVSIFRLSSAYELDYRIVKEK